MKAYQAIKLANKRKEIQKKRNERALLKVARKEVRAAAKVGRTTIAFGSEVYVSGFGFMPASIEWMKKHFEKDGYTVEILETEKGQRIKISWHTGIKPVPRRKLKTTSGSFWHPWW